MERLDWPYAQKEWKSRVALDFFLGGAGSSLIAFNLVNLFAFNENYELGTYISVLSVAFILSGLVLLASELGRLSNLWRSMTKFGKSWMARGSAFTLALLVTLVLLTVSFVVRASLAVVSPLYLITAVLSLMVSLYPGMLLHSVRDIKSWRSGVQPVLTFIEAASSGLGLLVLATVVSDSSLSTTVAEALLASTSSLILSIAFLGSLGRSSYPGARATYSKLTSLTGKISFYPFVILGCMLPIGCFLSALLFPNWAGVQPVAAVGAISLLAGNIVYRLLILLSARHESLTILKNRYAGSVLERLDVVPPTL